MSVRTNILPDQAYLRECFSYDRDTGVLTWKQRPTSHFKNQGAAATWNSKYAGTKALAYPSPFGYLYGNLNSTKHKAHRVVWKLEHGEEALFVDHVNGKREDNRISNLRSVTTAQNRRNAEMRKDNASGVNGVSWYSGRQRWVAEIRVSKGITHKRYFRELEEAVSYRKTCEANFGYHPNHGRTKP